MGHPAYHFDCRLDSFEYIDKFARGRVLRDATEMLITANRALIRAAKAAGQPMPPLYAVDGGGWTTSPMGIRYLDTQDQWRDAVAMQREGGGDCKDIVALDVAQRREAGQRAAPRILMQIDDENPDDVLYHVLTELDDGRIDDVCKKLGMP